MCLPAMTMLCVCVAMQRSKTELKAHISEKILLHKYTDMFLLKNK